MTAATRKKQITPADILSPSEYAKRRPAIRADIVQKKKNRRLEVGPFATFYFECFETMLQQVQEMLHIEKGGEAQIADELHAYNPLIPQGDELVATVMFEIDDPVRRGRALARLGGVEDTMFIKLGEEKVKGVAEQDQDRTTAEGKASSVQFVRFPFTREQIAKFRSPGQTVIIGLEHENYAHMAVMPDAVRKELASDFD
ncbi:MAG TPA: DUF3501 family protein [Dongiaceae bacterium]|jgi:hypothetical protein